MFEPLQHQSAGIDRLRTIFGSRLQEGSHLARYTAARVGGPADLLLEVQSATELSEAVKVIWENDIPYLILGGGSNVLISDAGVRGLVLINQARGVRFEVSVRHPTVWAESGANFGLLARQAAANGLAGLEWAVGIPGTVGGAVYGNAGAHDSDMMSCLLVADILHRKGLGQKDMPTLEEWSVERLGYTYRSSVLKENPGQSVVLSALIRLKRSTKEDVQARIDELSRYRRQTQPPGASMGSMFKNPSGDYAGRLIEVAGLKGKSIGGAQISTLHGNFFLNKGNATAEEVDKLIRMAKQIVHEKTGVVLELEIELVGDWT